MSADGSIELDFGGDRRTFRLAIENLLALQERRNAGPLEIAVRLQSGTWRVEDISETIRLGLMGGGMDGRSAKNLVDAMVKPPNITLHVLTALAVLLAALQGVPDDPAGKDQAVAGAPETAVSPPPPSTETVQ